MPQLRAAIVSKIENHLDAFGFGLAAYKCDFPERGENLVKIIFSANERYSFEIFTSGNDLLVRIAPGEYKTVDTYACQDIETAILSIHDWTRRIKEELATLGIKRVSLDEIISSVDEFIKEKVSEPEGNFTKEEIEDLQRRLSTLEQKFKELCDAEKIEKSELTQIRKAIKEASGEAIIYPRRVWYKASLTKVLSIGKAIATSKEGREIITAATKKVLGLE